MAKTDPKPRDEGNANRRGRVDYFWKNGLKGAILAAGYSKPSSGIAEALNITESNANAKLRRGFFKDSEKIKLAKTLELDKELFLKIFYAGLFDERLPEPITPYNHW